MGVTGVDIFAIACILFILSYLVYIVNYAIDLYELNPFNRPKPLTSKEIFIIKSKIPSINRLDLEQREILFKRVSWFRTRKHFTFRGPVGHKQELKLLVSTASCLLTLGMRNYKFRRSVHRIVIYPSEYYSLINRKHHLGEYNVGLKTVAFAADNLEKGFEQSDDNVNLAIHEFSHALYHETKGRNSWESLKFQAGFRRMERMFSDKHFTSRMESTGYFRDYAKANILEFFAVACENFMETPELFKRDFPTLFETLKKMFNLDLDNLA